MSIRTCLVTSKKEEPKKLLRFTIREGKLVFDDEIVFSPDSSGVRTGKKTKKNPGRGGYVMNDPEILKKLPHMRGKIQYYLKVKNLKIPENLGNIFDRNKHN